MRNLVTRFFTNYFAHLVIILLAFNVSDTFLTLYWVSNEIALEANPIMAFLLEGHPLLFVVTKLFLVGLGCLLLWRLRKSRASWVALSTCILVYLWVMTVHISIVIDTLGFVSQV